MSSTAAQQNHSQFEGNAHRAKLLLEATGDFCNSKSYGPTIATNQFTKLFYSLIGDTDTASKKLISSQLARNHNTPRPIAYYLAMEPIDVAAPMLLISPVFWQTDLIQLSKKLEPESLAILARRSDITPPVAQSLAEHGDQKTRQLLSVNPAAMLNAVRNPQKPVASENVVEDADTGQIENLKQELLDLVNTGGKGNKNLSVNASDDNHAGKREPQIGERLLAHIKAGEIHLIAREISDQIEMDVDKVNKIVMHENATSLAIFLKGLDVSSSQASELFLGLNNSLTDNRSELDFCMGQFDKFSTSQCRDIMRNLGAKLATVGEDEKLPANPANQLDDAVKARRRQIYKSHAPVLFGNQRKAS